MKRSFALKLPLAFICIIIAGTLGFILALLMLPVFLAEPKLMRQIADMVMQRFTRTMAQMMIKGGNSVTGNDRRNPSERGRSPDGNQQPASR